MQMSYKIGGENFARYQRLFNFGLKTNIDLPGESRTDTLIYKAEDLNTINLATNSFGQNFNVTMVQLASAYSSIVNGGTYYLPHVVNELEDENGNTVREIDPTRAAGAPVRGNGLYSPGISGKPLWMRGSGKTAKVDGYSMCGKTGTAEKFVLNEEGNAHLAACGRQISGVLYRFRPGG